jgi:hypothetical protein
MEQIPIWFLLFFLLFLFPRLGSRLAGTCHFYIVIGIGIGLSIRSPGCRGYTFFGRREGTPYVAGTWVRGWMKG